MSESIPPKKPRLAHAEAALQETTRGTDPPLPPLRGGFFFEPRSGGVAALNRCLRDSKTYDDALYLTHLCERKAPLPDLLPAA